MKDRSSPHIPMYVKHIEVAALLVIGLWVLWGVAGVQFFKEFVCKSDAQCSVYGQVGDVFGGINAFFAALGFIGLAISIEHTRRSTEEERLRNRDRELLEQVVKSYEWAHDALVKRSKPSRPRARADRMNWLISARHLMRAQKISNAISSATYRLLQQEAEEYWRTQFYLATNSTAALSADFFFEGGDEQRPVDLRSAIVIADFAGWKEGDVDPLDELDIHEVMLKRTFMTTRIARGIEKYIVTHQPGIAGEHKRRMALHAAKKDKA